LLKKEPRQLDKQEQVGLIRLSIDGINYLRTLPFHSPEFPAWRERVTQVLERIYGKDSAEYRRFVNAPGKAFIIRTETAQIEEYHRKLDCYESALKSLIGEE
jgi:hypothetical protein